MVLLVGKALRTLRERYSDPRVGRLVQPRHYPNLDEDQGMPWAADNDCFNGGLDAEGFWQMVLAASRCPSRPLFVTAPDVVGDARSTRLLFDEWEPLLHAVGVPVALVAQDGLKLQTVPWRRLDAVFIGGTDEFKDGPVPTALIPEAKRRGKHVHVGRVNSLRRVWRFENLGADTFDGTMFSRWSDRWIPWYLAHAEARERQGSLL